MYIVADRSDIFLFKSSMFINFLVLIFLPNLPEFRENDGANTEKYYARLLIQFRSI